MLDTASFREAIKAIAPYGPDGVIVFCIVTATILAPKMGVDPYFVGIGGFALYVLFGQRQTKREEHEERLALTKVKGIEAENESYRLKQVQKLKKAQQPALPPAPAKKRSRGG